LNSKIAPIKTSLLHIKTIIEIDNSFAFGLNVNGYKMEYNVSKNTLNGHFLPLKDRQLELEVVVDITLIEVYANGGLLYWFANHNEGDLDDFTVSFFQNKNGLNPNPKTLIKSLVIEELKSIWRE
tara:strand:+ start:442 stop:816 length:375 start_codon:yes stop_codon:yes gene_type:complete